MVAVGAAPSDPANTLITSVGATHNPCGGTAQVVSAFFTKKGDVPSAPHKSWPTKARPLDILLTVATGVMNWSQVPKPVSDAVPGWLKRTIEPLFLKPTQRSPRGLRVAAAGRPGFPGSGQPVVPPPKRAPVVLPAITNTLEKSRK